MNGKLARSEGPSWSQFHQHFFRAFFCTKIWRQNNQTQNTALEFWVPNFVQKMRAKKRW